jgi:signal transduction histidine kinase
MIQKISMKSKITFTCLLIILFIGLISYVQTVPSYAIEHKDVAPKIFLLSSYNNQFEWSNQVMNGVDDTLDAYFPKAKIRIEYMDTKNIISDAYFEELFRTYKFKYEHEAFDAIISMDDNALKFLLDYREDLFPGVPIFFCGVNWLDNYNLTNQVHLYGIEEKPALEETLNSAIKLNAKLEDIYVVVDNSVSGQATKALMERDLQKSNLDVNLIFLDNMPFDQVIEILKGLQDEKSAVLYTFYNFDSNHNSYTIKETTEQVVTASKVPVYGLWSFSYGQGIVGGKLISGYAHGEKAVEMAVDYFNGVRYEKDQHLTSIDATRYMFDYAAMKKHFLNINKIPDGSIIINKPQSFYEEHKKILQVTFALVLFLLIYIVLLKRQVRHRTAKIVKQEKMLMEAERLASLGSVVAGVAHEVNTPLGNAVMLASFIKKENGRLIELVNSEAISYSEFIKSIDRSHESLESLTYNLSRTENIIQAFKSVVVHFSSEDMEIIDFALYLDKFIDRIRMTIPCNFELECKENSKIKASQSSLFKIFSQLVENSVTHGFIRPEQGRILIRVWQKNDRVVIEYSDNGKGIKSDMVKEVFNPFVTDRRGEGHTGLGLYSVYNLVTAMGGVISYSDDLDKGVGFIMELPKYIGGKQEGLEN